MYDLITIFIVVVLILCLYFYYQPDSRHKAFGELIPGPKAYPFIGNLPAVGIDSKNFTNILRKLAEDYGPIFRLFLVRDLTVFISDPEDIEVVLAESKQVNKSKSSVTCGRSWIGEGLLLAPEEKWKVNRKRIVPAFHIKILENFLPTFTRNVNNLIEEFSQKVDGPAFNVTEPVAMFALRNICETVMGIDLATLPDNSKYPKAVEDLNSIFITKLFVPIFESDLLFKLHPLGRKEKGLLNYVHSLTEKVIKSRKAEKIETEQEEIQPENLAEGQRRRLILLDLLLKVQSKDTTFDDQQIRDEVSTFMFAGHDTVAVTISFCLHLLAQHRDVQDKIYEETKNILNGSERPFTYHDLQEMRYLEQVIKETLRIYPSVPAIGRNNVSDIKLKSGYLLPSHTEIVIFIHQLHRNPEVFPDPDRFNPENFSAENMKNRHAFAFLPFGGGPRDCIGMKYAMMELKIVLSNLVRNFIFLPGSQPKLFLISEIVLKSRDGVSVKIIQR